MINMRIPAVCLPVFVICAIGTIQFLLPNAGQISAPPVATFHPLDPLSRTELIKAVELLKMEKKMTDSTYISLLALKEPPKEQVLQFQPGAPITRKAFVVLFDRKANKTVETVVNLTNKKLESWEPRPGVQPTMLAEEYQKGGELVRSDRTWRKAMENRGITNFDEVQLDVWATGYRPAGVQDKQARIYRVLSYWRGKRDNAMVSPIEACAPLAKNGTSGVKATEQRAHWNWPSIKRRT